MSNCQPPKWADRFLAWYCNPDLLEEIQGDAHELYAERVKSMGKAAADRKYILDVIRFFRWSNIRRSGEEHKPGLFAVLWNLNFKMELRNAWRNKLVFTVKTLGLSVCLAFALILTAFILHEFTFDRYHASHERIFRIGSKITIQGVVTEYAVSPVALGDGLADEIPEVEGAVTCIYSGKPVFTIEDRIFNNEVTYSVSPEFLRTLTFDFIHGDHKALDDPGRVVLTETTARKFFGDADPLGQVIDLEWTTLEVAGVIRDVPANSHLKFAALISWGTYEVNEGWDNINAYTYIKLRANVDISDVRPKIEAVIRDHREEINGGHIYRAADDIAIAPIIENIADIHLSKELNEDVAVKRSKSNLYILVAVVVLFLVTGLINYMNLSLAELTTNIHKITILRIFGGTAANHSRIVAAPLLFGIVVIIPVTFLLISGGVVALSSFFSITMDQRVFLDPVFVAVASGFILVLFLSSRINSFILARSNDIINSLKGKINMAGNGFRIREFLVATQLSFSIIMIALIIIIVDQFRFIQSADKGFEDRNTLIVKMRTDDFDATTAFEEAVRQLHGVNRVDGSSFHLDNVETKELFEVNTAYGEKKMMATYMNCGYEYLGMLGIRFISGRNFNEAYTSDIDGAYIINETAAREFGWKEPVGQRIRGPLGTDRYEGDVIGVVKDFNFASLHSRIEPLIIFLVDADWGTQYVYVNVDHTDAADVVDRIGDVYKSHFPGLPFEWEYLDTKYKNLYKEDYEVRDIINLGLAISVLLSCLGVFSISALLATLRAREMGIRKVVGANPYQLFLLHVLRFAKFLVIAVLVAWPAIYYLSRHWLDNFAYHIDLGAQYFIVPGIITLGIILFTSGFHGVKTARVNPVDVLKHE